MRELAAKRITERAGRTAMASMTRTFRIPKTSLASIHDDTSDGLHIDIFEPALTGDNLGHKTWSSSYVVARRLPELLPHLPTSNGADSQTTALELGAGTGLLGIAFAALSQTKTTLTDLPEIVDNLQKNIEVNIDILETSDTRLACAAVLDWTVPSRLQYVGSNSLSEHPLKASVILAADPIYAPLHPSLLVRTILYHIDRGNASSRAVIAYPARSAYAPQIEELRNELDQGGMMPVVEGTERDVRDDWDQLITVAWGVWGWKE